MMNTHEGLRRNQVGLVSIVVTMILILVISVITLGFAKVVRREQRIQLDRQLSSRAFYAAESGINLAADKIKNGYTEPKLYCEPDNNGTAQITDAEYQIDGNDTKLTCLTINPSPDVLKYNGINTTSRVIPMDAGSSTIDGIKINWQSTTMPVSPAGCGSVGGFPKGTSNPGETWDCGYPLIRIDLVKTPMQIPPNPPPTFSRADLQNNLFTAFLYPLDSSGTDTMSFADGGGNNKGFLAGAKCDATQCTMEITGLPSSNGYTARVMSLYGSANLEICAMSAGSCIPLRGAQTIIDSTAKAVDVLRRVQVRVPSANEAIVPDFTIFNTGDLCKLYVVGEGIRDLCDGEFNCEPVSRDIALVMDASHSMINNAYGGIGALRAEVQRDAVLDFINNRLVLSDTGNKLALLQFNDEPIPISQTQTLTTDKVALSNTAGPVPYLAATHYRAALQKAEDLLGGAGSRPGAEKVIIFMSDGRPNDLGDSTVAQQQATANYVMNKVNALKGSGYKIYSLAIDYTTNGTDVLPQMATTSGGFYDADQDFELAAFLQQIAAKLSCL